MISTVTDPTIESPQRLQVNHLEYALKSIGRSKGSATISEHIGTVGVFDIHSCVMKDVENFKECPLGEMLKNFLMHSTGKLQELFDDDPRWTDIKPNSSMIKEYLAIYSRAHARRADKLYPPFMIVANVALLQEMDDLRPDDSPVYFHVHDPSSLRQFHQSKFTERKPVVVVVVVSRPDARDTNSSEQQMYYLQDVFFTVFTKALKKQLQWSHVRTFVEFKRATRNMEAPPDWHALTEIASPEEHEYLGMDVLNNESESDVFPARPPPSKLVRRSARQQEKAADTNPDSRKRTSEDLDPLETQSKRQKSEHAKSHPIIVQAGYCVEEIFTAIGLVIVDNVLYVWRCDRQGTIQYSRLNFIVLPRFLVLLAMQCFKTRHWGLNLYVDCQFGPRPPLRQTTLRGNEGKEIQSVLGLSDETRVPYFNLNGRATNVFPVGCKDFSEGPNPVFRFFWMEITCMGEPELLTKAYEIAETNPEVNGHVPEMSLCKTFHDTSTQECRGLIFRKLRPITELHGNKCLKAWWATVRCHGALWRNGVFHRDISPSNLTYRMDEQQQIVAVLHGFDLVSTQGMATRTTGMAPFMAVQLLDEAVLQCKIPHVYTHDAESFIWTLIWITLRYANGKLKGDRNRPLDKWLRLDPIGCRKKKKDFLVNSEVRDRLKAGAGHEQNWKMAEDCIMVLMKGAIEKYKAKKTQEKENLGSVSKTPGGPESLSPAMLT